MNILIIGNGRIGGAMELLLKKHKPILWDVEPEKSHNVDCDLATRNAEIIFLCAPTSAHDEIMERIAFCGSTKVLVVSTAKGLDSKGQTVHEIMKKYIPEKRIGLLCGPMMAEEIMRGSPSFAVIASKNILLAKKIEALFSDTKLKVSHSKDTAGVAWLSVLKNVYATLFGVMEGLELGCNMRGFLMTEIAIETQKLLALFGGAQKTWFGPAGIGDLVCTISSPHSRNRTYGESLALGKDAKKGEGAEALKFLKLRLEKDFADYSLLVVLDKILKNPKKARELFNKMLI